VTIGLLLKLFQYQEFFQDKMETVIWDWIPASLNGELGCSSKKSRQLMKHLWLYEKI
jgi:hypothetical protein